MQEVNFNMKVLEHFRKSDDSMYQDIANDCKDDFTNYASLVSNFSQKVNELRETEDTENYQILYSQLDRKRKRIHDNCLEDIKMINRMAKLENLPPFCNADERHNRTDIGSAIIEQMHENSRIGQTRVTKKSKHMENRNKMENYNYMLKGGFTKYPIIKDENGKFKFINLFTIQKVKPAIVEQYVKTRTDDPKKLEFFNTAKQLTEPIKTKDEPEL